MGGRGVQLSNKSPKSLRLRLGLLVVLIAYAASCFFHFPCRNSPVFELARVLVCLGTFFVIAVERKRGRIRRMKHWKTALAILGVLAASIVLADDVRRIWWWPSTKPI